MQNKANFKIGKMNISIATIKDYDKEQRTINNERYSKQTQSNPISKAKNWNSQVDSININDWAFLRMRSTEIRTSRSFL